MKKVRITAVRKACYLDLMERYENPMEHACDVQEGQVWIANGWQKPEGLCDSAWESMSPFVMTLAHGGGDFYDGWMKNPKSAMISCNDGFRPVSFYIEALEEPQIRDYAESDCPELAQLFYETVHTVNAGDYTEDQLNAWATGKVDLANWNESFLAHHTVVAELDGQIVGFGDMDDSGYLDRLYVHKDCQRRGVATAICNALEGDSEARDFTTHASITAKPFFEKRGYRAEESQQVIRGGIALTNFVMHKTR